MKIAGFYDESISNGLGWRAVLFASGCPHNCYNCHNKDAQNFNYGEEFNEDEVVDRIVNNPILKGVTLSGGEPLCMENIDAELSFVKKLKATKPELNVWCYTGYTFEELLQRTDSNTKEILTYIDILIDGKYVEMKKDPDLKFRGSSNQRILDVQKCLGEHRIVELAV